MNDTSEEHLELLIDFVKRIEEIYNRLNRSSYINPKHVAFSLCGVGNVTESAILYPSKKLQDWLNCSDIKLVLSKCLKTLFDYVLFVIRHDLMINFNRYTKIFNEMLEALAVFHKNGLFLDSYNTSVMQQFVGDLFDYANDKRWQDVDDCKLQLNRSRIREIIILLSTKPNVQPFIIVRIKAKLRDVHEVFAENAYNDPILVDDLAFYLQIFQKIQKHCIKNWSNLISNLTTMSEVGRLAKEVKSLAPKSFQVFNEPFLRYSTNSGSWNYNYRMNKK